MGRLDSSCQRGLLSEGVIIRLSPTADTPVQPLLPWPLEQGPWPMAHGPETMRGSDSLALGALVLSGHPPGPAARGGAVRLVAGYVCADALNASNAV